MSQIELQVVDPAKMIELGEALARNFQSGDLIVLDGVVGAGKTTLTKGIAKGLKVKGSVTSPTFVIARVHESQVNGPELVHVDAYRLSSVMEVDGLDLESSLDGAVTVVEWGSGLIEGLTPENWLIQIVRDSDESNDLREVTITIPQSRSLDLKA
jgi:tRNA threonylcarbamoyladenosine biosynthesis protein TsaE